MVSALSSRDRRRACRTCGRRVQGRHRLQCSDALGAAGVQLGPQMVASQPKLLGERWKRGWELLREIGTLERYVRELREYSFSG